MTANKMGSGLFGLVVVLKFIRKKKAITKTTKRMASGLLGIRMVR